MSLSAPRLAVFASICVVAFGALAGCGESCPGGGTGSLEVVIDGLPEGAQGSVEVEPAAAGLAFEASRVVDGVAAGSHPVKVNPVAVSGGLVRRAYRGVADPTQVCIREGQQSQLHVNYGLIPSSHKLWASVANGAATMLGFDESLLRASGSSPATVAAKLANVPRAGGTAFDREGNLWVASGAGTIRRYSADALGASGSPAADRVLSGSAIGGGVPGPVALAFDGKGNLWASIAYSGQLVRFSAEQLTAGGPLVPERTLDGFQSPAGLAFDLDGNLWVADRDAGEVARIPAASLVSAAAAPDLRVSATLPTGSGSLTTPLGLAFDGEGNLWVTYFGSNVIAALGPAERTGSGAVTVTPAVQLTLDVGALLGGIAFDDEGNLWTAHGNGELGRLSKPQLTGSGTVTPEIQLSSGDLGAAQWLSFYPAPAHVPLYAALPELSSEPSF